jgi:hypothetical protein
VARIAAVLCLFAAVALVPAVAFAVVKTTPSPSPIPATAANFQIVTLGASGGTAPYATFYQIDSGPVWTYSTLLGNVPVLSKFGSHTLTYWSADSTFATETPNVATVNITDSTKPLTTIPFPSGQAFDSSASFNLVATDNFLLPASYGMTTVGSGVASTQYKLVTGGFGHTGTPPAAWTTGSTVATSALGDYTLYFRSTDVRSGRAKSDSGLGGDTAPRRQPEEEYRTCRDDRDATTRRRSKPRSPWRPSRANSR